MSRRGTLMPLQSIKFRLRTGVAPVAIAQRLADFLKSRLAWLPQITVLSRVAKPRPIREFLIVGCQHGWLDHVGCDCEDSGWPRFAAVRVKGLFWYGFCSIYVLCRSVPE